MRTKDGFDSPWPGLVGGLVALAAAFVLRSLTDTHVLAEIIVDASTDQLEPRGFSFFLDLFGGSAKPLLFLSVLIGELAFYVLAWRIVTSRLSHDQPSRILLTAGGVTAAVLLLFTAALVAFTEATMHDGWGGYVFATLVGSALYATAATFIAVGQGSTGEGQDAFDARRNFLRQVPVLLLGGTASIIVAKVFLGSTGGGAQSSHAGEPTIEVTPTEDFYVVSKNLIDPKVESKGWRLRVGGFTQQMLELSYDDVLAWPSREQYATLQCISNEVGGNLMGNALWAGFPLRELLARAQPTAAASYVMFRCDDGYTESLPLEFAMNDGVMLVHTMNGERLTDKHGFPLRLLTPGKYGVKNPKWLSEITLLDRDFQGYWELRDWDQVARMNTSTRIDVPKGYSTITESTYRIHGVAFSGDRGISRVEVSTDGGSSWNDAVIKPALSPYTWVLWSYDWTNISGKSRIELQARATDGTGDVQTSEREPPYPAGATGYPRLPVTIQVLT